MGRFTRQDVKEYQQIDPVTGEITTAFREVSAHTITQEIKEERFIKVYYDMFLASVGENSSPMSDFLIAIGKHMVIKDNMQVVQLTKFTKEMIAEETGKSLDRINHYIGDCVKMNLLYRIGTPRSATYAVSPFIMSKSTGRDVEVLQMNYKAKKGVLEISKPDPTKQIEQLHFQGFEPEEGEIENE